MSYRSSESDHNHIFLIYPYILYVVAAISHIRGIQRPLLSQSKRHRSQLKTHKSHNFMLHFNIIISYDAVHSSLTHRGGQRHFMIPFNYSTIHHQVEAKLRVQGVVGLKKPPGSVPRVSAFKMEVVHCYSGSFCLLLLAVLMKHIYAVQEASGQLSQICSRFQSSFSFGAG